MLVLWMCLIARFSSQETGIDLGSLSGIDLGSLSGIDIGSFPGIDLGSLSGIDIGSFPGIDLGSFPGMDLGSLSGMAGGVGSEVFCNKPELLPAMFSEFLKCYEPLCTYQKTCGAFMEDAMGDSSTGMDDSSNDESNGPPSHGPPSLEQLKGQCENGCLTGMFGVMKQMASCMGNDSPTQLKMPNSDEIESQLNTACLKNPINDEYCMVSFMQVEKSLPEKGLAMNATAQQKQLVCGGFSKLGCCLSSQLASFGMDDSSDEGNHDSTMPEFNEANILSFCGWTKLTPPCGKFGEKKKYIKFSIKSDIRWSDWSRMTEAEKTVAEFAATQDLKTALGVDLLASAFTEDANGNVLLNFNADSTGSPDLKKQIQESLASQAPNWSHLEVAIPAVDAVTTSSDVVVEEEEVTHTFPDTLPESSSNKKMPGFFVLYSVLFLWILF